MHSDNLARPSRDQASEVEKTSHQVRGASLLDAFYGVR